MPFVIASGDPRKTVEAILCQANLLGQPDRRSSVPVLIRQLSERTLLVEPDDPREIISTLHRDGQTTFAVGPGRKALAASARLARLQKASELLEQLRSVLMALKPADTVLDHHTALSDWVRSERDAVRNSSPIIRSKP